jgi:4-hydroxy-3-methylbut-2-en-1-yl diphosphate synthase IspG/GcpE
MDNQHSSAPTSAPINVVEPLYGQAADTIRDQLREPSDLEVAISVAQLLLADYGDSSRDGFSYPEAYGALRESLRLLLRALGAETVTDATPTCPTCGRTFEDCICTGIRTATAGGAR